MKEKDDDEDMVVYGKNLNEEVWRYSQKAKLVAQYKDFDIIHAHNYRNYLTRIAIQVAKKKKVPIVLSTHGSLLNYKQMVTGINTIHGLKWVLLRVAVFRPTSAMAGTRVRVSVLAFALKAKKEAATRQRNSVIFTKDF